MGRPYVEKAAHIINALLMEGSKLSDSVCKNHGNFAVKIQRF